MGILDKLKGHKKDDSVKSFDDVANQKHKRSSSVGRKSVERSRGTKGETIPELPGQTSTVGHTGTVPVATYPVEGTTAVDSTTTHHTSHQTRPQISDNLSTAAIKDGTTGETDVDGLSRDMQRQTLNTTSTEGVSHSYTPFSYDSKNLTQTPFDREAFHASLGNRDVTTDYESVTRPAVVQETVRANVLEEIHPVFHREHHVIHHQTRIQPVLEQVFLAPKHYVLIDGQKHEITGDAVMNHVVKARDYIPMAGHVPKVTVHQYVDSTPLVGPITGVGASLINKDVMLEHQRLINTSYEHKAAGREHGIPTGQVTKVNYMPGQVPVSTVPGVGPSTLASSSVAGTGNGHHHHESHHSGTHATGNTSGSGRLAVDDAIERTSERLPEQRASKY
ncbi:protein of unknown function [Taphrina deformans PYCC 5710]|uniref:Uncharacterized protein n=1 Tax=Taphrina deformans (strain PYCC 5710 / ATCC 11124 / CBS 356.35 / IMI 108563 / JCM 9778 / NBRC 8474) TaxID=1097556 RepID=R4X996_TAPDE|nr:protein of unknown function [Taphrina deformans PYCC 5710]|eukprot:CCG81995.1 protein of unknown function [Taphrina deformans PYCC 5710]